MNNEQLSASAFSRQSVVFDDIYASNTIVHYKRERVRNHINQYVHPNSYILELNSGTGEDAVYFAQQGHHIHATDIAEGMQQKLNEKVKWNNLEHKVTTELCSFTQLNSIKNKGPYDLIFSNFAGLNCTDKLNDVLLSFRPLLTEHGLVTLVLLPPFCLWELMMLFRGKFKTAFRRLNSKHGVNAHVEGVHFKCWYYRPSYIINTLKNDFELVDMEGLCTIVPPSYIEGFAEKHPRLYANLKKLEGKYKRTWPWKYTGDYYIITLRKK